MDKIILVTTREDKYLHRAEIEGHPEAGIKHGKKVPIAIGALAKQNPSFFNIKNDGESLVWLNNIEEGILGKLIQKNKEKFNVKEVKHVGK